MTLATAFGFETTKGFHLDLSKEWLSLVETNKVVATLTNKDETSTTIRYGVRFCQDTQALQEYVECNSKNNNDPIIQQINTTLTELQKTSSSFAIQSKIFNSFVAQLQLIRTLRPPPSPGISSTTTTKTTQTNIPPDYNVETDSFVTGPLRLNLRPLVGKVPAYYTDWDIYHNISPADVRGHFLLVPTLEHTNGNNINNDNNRGQCFVDKDCRDIVELTKTIVPTGSLLIGYNSIGAGASQNHIHCHAWPNPPSGLLGHIEDKEQIEGKQQKQQQQDETTESSSSSSYAICKVKSIFDFCDVTLSSENINAVVEVSWLEYPVMTVQLSSCCTKSLALSLSTVLDCVGTAPYNLGFLNRQSNDNDDIIFVDVYVFIRSLEKSPLLPTLKLGISEMMGLFHAQSAEQLEYLVSPITTTTEDDDVVDNNDDNQKEESKEKEENNNESPSVTKKCVMQQALKDISYKKQNALWKDITTALSKLTKK